MPGSGFVLKLNTEAGLITSPDPQGVPIFQRYFLGGILDIRGFYLRSIGPRLPLQLDGPRPNSPPITNGANIGGNLELYARTSSSSSRSSTRWVSAASSSSTPATPGTPSSSSAPRRRLRSSPTWCSRALSNFPNTLALVRTSDRHFSIRWFSPLGPLRFEWGFPLCTGLPTYENHSDFEFTIGNFF